MKPLERTICKSARALLGWTMDDLAREAGVSLATVSQFERGKTKNLVLKSERAVLSAFERAGVRVLQPGDMATDEGGGVAWRVAVLTKADDVLDAVSF